MITTLLGDMVRLRGRVRVRVIGLGLGFGYRVRFAVARPPRQQDARQSSGDVPRAHLVRVRNEK